MLSRRETGRNCQARAGAKSGSDQGLSAKGRSTMSSSPAATDAAQDPPQDTPAAPERLECVSDAGFNQWIAASGGSIACSTYQAGKLLLIGWGGQRVSLLPRTFLKPMGLDVDGNRMVLASRHAVTLFHNDPVLAHDFDAAQPGRFDALYLPRLSWHMADLSLHDVALAGNEVWAVNTLFSCLSTLSEQYSFVPRWRPHFISAIAAEDRCHLNGLAMVDGQPGYVTALGETDHAAGWREHKTSGGILMDVRSQQVILRGLAMPHSPRWHQGQLYVLNSGAGQLLRVNSANGAHEVICELPGYLRGLHFHGRHALVGLCRIRETNEFGGMPVQKRCPELQCGVAVIDLDSGRQLGMLTATSGCTEIYDLRFLPGLLRVNVLHTEREAAKQAYNAPDLHGWLRPAPTP